MSRPFEGDLIAYLRADGGVAAIAGARVHLTSRPQGSALPAVTVSRISGAPEYADDGEVGLTQGRVQVDCWAATASEAKDLAAAVVDRLSAAADVVQGSTTFRFITLDNEQDLRESGSNQAEYDFRTMLDFQIWVQY